MPTILSSPTTANTTTMMSTKMTTSSMPMVPITTSKTITVLSTPTRMSLLTRVMSTLMTTTSMPMTTTS